jgi:hypothetical protein
MQMKQVRWLRIFAVAAISLMLALPLAAQGDPAALQQRLNTQFRLTTTTADRTDIVTAGDVVVIHKPGLIMYAVASPMPPSNTYKNGSIGQGWGGFGKDLLISMGSSGGTTAADYPHRTFVPEEKCWVTGIQVQKDGVLFQLYSDPYDDIRYYANLKIPFPNKKAVPPVDAFMQTVAEVLASDSGDGPGGPSGQSATAPPAPLPVIAPPPPPPDAPPPTVVLGQTEDQVTAGFGQPLRTAKLGVKEIYYYKDMKVTFRNGKVSDVE